MPAMHADERDFGGQLRRWRQARHVSQFELAEQAGVSTRHVSFIETGRSRPSREMVLLLAEQLQLPLREQNAMLLAAGFAPEYPHHDFEAPELATVRAVVDLMLRNHMPFPALAIDRAGTLIAANLAAPILTEGLSPALLAPPRNVYRTTLHPDGLRSRIVNFDVFAGRMLAQLRRDAQVSGHAELQALLREVEAYPGLSRLPAVPRERADVALPLHIRTRVGVLSLITTFTTFGTPLAVTVSDLAIELLFPADPATEERLRHAAAPQEERR